MTARAVIIDDELPARQRLGRLIREGLDGRVTVVGEAGDGEAGLALIEQEGPDLAFVDVQMPGMDGIALCERVATNRPDLPVVVITATAPSLSIV